MATMHKFKMLATQCAVAGSPTRSPSTSPVIHLRRRKTLRMLLTRGGDGNGNGNGNRRLPSTDEFLDRRGSDADSSEDEKDNNNNNNINNKINNNINNKINNNTGSRRKLKDLFVTSSNSNSNSSSPPVEEIGEEANRWSGYDCDLVVRRGGGRGFRLFPGTLRQRLMRRAWRPVLVAIPE